MTTENKEKLKIIENHITALASGASYVVRKTSGFTEGVYIVEQLLKVITEQEDQIHMLSKKITVLEKKVKLCQ